MLSEQDALQRVLAATCQPQAELCPLAEAAGRWLVEEVRAELALPGTDISVMDGYALHEADCGSGGRRVQVCGEQPAGRDEGCVVTPGRCVRIFTGAPLPHGTGAVVMQEDVSREGEEIIINEAAAVGEWLRREGSDVCAGQVVGAMGARLTPALLGVLAGQGLVQVRCGRLPRIAVVCTGEELVDPGQPLPGKGTLYNSNGPMLRALFAECAAAVTVITVADDRAILRERLAAALAEHDVVVTVGGASVGDHDLVKPVLADLGVVLDFWKVQVKPGKPFLFAGLPDKMVFGLPGNPVSALVTAMLFVLPALRRMAGAAVPGPIRRRVAAATQIENAGDRPHYIRATWREDGVWPAGAQESHALAGLSRADVLALLPAHTTVAAGTYLEVILL